MAHLVANVRLALATFWVACALPSMAAELGFVTIEAAPWASHDAAGRPLGAFPAIVAQLERRTGHRIAIALYPLARIDQAMASGQQDCTIVLWNEHRARLVVRFDDIYPMPFGVVARKGLPLQRYDDLAPRVISVTRGLAMDARFDADTALRKDVDRDYLTGLLKIAHGRADAIAGALPTIRHIARAAGLDGHLGESLTLGRVPLALQCSKRSPQLGAVGSGLNAALRAMRADGSLARILAEHGYR